MDYQGDCFDADFGARWLTETLRMGRFTDAAKRRVLLTFFGLLQRQPDTSLACDYATNVHGLASEQHTTGTSTLIDVGRLPPDYDQRTTGSP